MKNQKENQMEIDVISTIKKLNKSLDDQKKKIAELSEEIFQLETKNNELKIKNEENNDELVWKGKVRLIYSQFVTPIQNIFLDDLKKALKPLEIFLQRLFTNEPFNLPPGPYTGSHEKLSALQPFLEQLSKLIQETKTGIIEIKAQNIEPPEDYISYNAKKILYDFTNNQLKEKGDLIK